MTEDEAKTKTCHRSIIPVATADGSAPWFSFANCMGSACMAWRVDYSSPRPIAETGYCGLAGKP